MKTAIIFLHGNLSDVSYLKQYLTDEQLVICADGGVEHAQQLDILPDVVIGDFDSISEHDKTVLEQKGVTFVKYPKEKDYTDAELAVQYAIDQTVDRIIISGLLGDRVDHMMANVFFLADLYRDNDICIVEKDQEIRFVDGAIDIKGEKDDEVSLIPMQSDCQGITTEGLYYPLVDVTLPLGSTRGISNIMISKQSKVVLKKGLLMVIHRRRGR